MSLMPFGRTHTPCSTLPGGFAGKCAAGVRSTSGRRAVLRKTLALLAGLMLLLPAIAASAAEHGDPITNNARLTTNELPSTTTSVTVQYVVRTTSELSILKYAPGSAEAQSRVVATSTYRTGESPDDPFESLEAPRKFPEEEPIDLDGEIPLAPGAVFHRGEPIFLQLSDPDQNLDFGRAETVVVTLTATGTTDEEILRLTETGPDTGVFAGYIQSGNGTGTPYNGRMTVESAERVEARYVDVRDPDDESTAATLFDPYGIIFDSVTGLPVDGTEVTLIDAANGEPATVYGDNGISRFPSTVTSGETATDSDGNLYDFRPGAFRFPFVAPGEYRLEIEPPAGYAAPSAVSDQDLQALPGGPYALVQGSRGETFDLDPGPALRIDIPVDPVASGDLWLRKTAGKSRVAAGDFIPYRIEAENPHQGGMTGIALTDRLPAGFRYRSGSARIDGERTGDPAISADGRTLTFDLGNVPPQSSAELRYVTEVTAGARPGEAVNSVSATAERGGGSNTAEAMVVVGEDFFRSTTFLMGQVATGACGEQGPDELDGIPGARIYLEDGTYVTTDENGLYHLEGIRPGVHVVQLDLDSLPEQYEVVPCEENSRFAGRPYSRFVDLQGGSMWRADFQVALRPRARGEVRIELSSTLEEDTAAFRVPIEVGAVDLRNLRLTVRFPDDIEFLKGSARLGQQALAAPAAERGGLVFQLGDAEAGRRMAVTFRGRVSEDAFGEMSTVAQLVFDTPTEQEASTAEADNVLRGKINRSREKMPDFTVRPQFPTLNAGLSGKDRAELDRLAQRLQGLDIIHLHAMGHTDDKPIKPHNRHIFTDNYALSEARAESVARYLGEALNLPPGKISITGAGSAIPVADNSTSEGRALNRRVEVRVQCEKVSETIDLQLVKERSGKQETETIGLRPGETWDEEEKDEPASNPAEKEPGILSPADGSVLASRIAAVRVRLDGKLKPRLLLDGEEIPADRIGFKMEDEESGLNLYSYIGVDLGEPGEHTLKIEGIGPFGNARFEQSATIFRSGEIDAVRLLETGENIADGRTPVTLKLELRDESGKVIRAPAGLEILEGNLLAPEDRKAVENDVDALEEPGTTVTVDADGIVRFAPVETGGLYSTTLGYGERTLEVETYVKPQLRDWILVGLAEGTMGYNEVSGNMETLPPEADKDLYDDGRVAFFGKGRVLGKWLLTMAYDSDKPDREDKELFQVIDPDAYYTLYGDASQQQYEAASAEKLYVKMERDQFYALFGDYTTGLSKTELSRYSRSLTGLKSEFSGKYATFNLFASDTSQNFVKEEIRGDGTSGLYRLSREDIVLNSEKVTIEVRDRFRSEEIVSSRELSRHVDYNIDYEEGTLFFKEPIPSRDENFNPVHIVVDYEVTGQGDTSLNYGGRGAVRWPQKGVEIGATAVHEERDNAEGDLYGLDATWDITEATRLKGEVATTDSHAPGVSRDGRAWLAELEHRSPELDGKVYIRELEDGFGLGQQNGSEEGTRKYGADGDYSLNPDLRLGGTVYRQENLETGAVRDVAQTDLTYDADRYSLSTGLRFAEDEFENGERERSTQALFGWTWQPFERLLLRAAHEQSIGGNDESSDFPTRTTLGADFKLTEATTLFAAQEFTAGDDTESQNTRIGFKTTPWTGGSLDSALERQTGKSGQRMFALFGLNQSLKLSDRWSVDASLDRSQTVRDPSAEDFDTDVPPASGDTEDFTAVSLGTTYKLKDWSWANRLEYRDGDAEDKWGLFSAVVGEVRQGLGLSARAQLFTTESDVAQSTDGEIRLGLAYRPLYSRWIVLDRLDFIFEEESTDTSDYDNWWIINNLNANYKPTRRTQISLQYGLKYVRDHIDGESYDGFTDLTGVEGRYDLTESWDIGLRGSLLHSWNGHQLDYGAGASLGYNVMKNAWVSLGYNLLGFRDEDFSRADFTAQGPFMNFRFKFDQNSVREAARWLGGERP